MARAVKFDEYGDRTVLHVVDIEVPDPAPGRVLVEVRAAGTNPGEAAIRSGAMAEMFPSTFPSGQGSDLAGVVVGVGEGVTAFAPGDEVLGWSEERSSHASHVAVPVGQLVPKPAELDWSVAGSLYVVGATAYAAVRAVGAREGETVVVSAAAGGVGSLVVQLLRLRGAEVIGIASEGNHEWLRSVGAVPVAYADHAAGAAGSGLADRIRTLAPSGVDAFIDLFGPQYVDLALELGVAPERIDTIISFARAAEVGAKTEGSSTASTPEVIGELAGLLADGRLHLPVASTYPLERVRDAYAELEERHTHGKVVLLP